MSKEFIKGAKGREGTELRSLRNTGPITSILDRLAQLPVAIRDFRKVTSAFPFKSLVQIA